MTGSLRRLEPGLSRVDVVAELAGGAESKAGGMPTCQGLASFPGDGTEFA